MKEFFKQFGYVMLLSLLLEITVGCQGGMSPPAQIDKAGGNTAQLRKRAVRITEESLAAEDPRLRANAVEVVASTGTKTLMPYVKNLLKDDFVPVRYAAALAVGDTKYRAAEGYIRRLMKDPDKNVHIAAAYALYKLGDQKSINVIQEAIADSDQQVRANAAVLLGKAGNKSSLKLLHQARKSRDSRVRLQAAEAIARLGDEKIYKKLWAMQLSVYTFNRLMGVKAMGALGTPQAHTALLTMLDDDILEIRLAAAEQLGKLSDTTGQKQVTEVFEKNLMADMEPKDKQRLKVLAALAIGEICTKRLAKYLPILLDDESKIVRVAAAKAILRCTNLQKFR